jgi:2-keto-4-pentenoate hydratase/2-oxohepta-3-ene-1,7-dioic acid hydratase in catechol pathway
MKLATFLSPGNSEPLAGEIRGDRIVAFGDGSTVKEHLAFGGGEGAGGEAWPLDDIVLLAPVPAPGTIYCVGLNYRSHIEETGRTAPERPLIFLKPTASSIPGNGVARRPAVVQKLDYEGELAVVVGVDGKVGGYAVANDLSARDLQRIEPQWSRAKGADDFCPWGPWVTTPDEVPEPQHLRLRTWVNGELRQDINTQDLLFGIDEILSFLQETNTLRPGDLILTGTGAGVGESMNPPQFLQPGDTVKVAIDSLGQIEHRIIER